MRLTFGKHEGKTLQEILAIPSTKSDRGGGRGYLKWLMEETEDDVIRSAVENVLNGNSQPKVEAEAVGTTAVYPKAGKQRQGYASPSTRVSVQPKEHKQQDSAVWEAKDRMNMGQSAMRSATEQVAAEITAGIIKTKKAIDERWSELYTQRTFILEAAKNGQHNKEERRD